MNNFQILLNILFEKNIIFYDKNNQIKFRSRKNLNIKDLNNILDILNSEYLEFHDFLRNFPQNHWAASEILYCIIHNMNEPHKCPDCGKYTHFINRNKGYYTYCARCSAIKSRPKLEQTMLERYGVNNAMQLQEFAEKCKRSNEARSESQRTESREKAKLTCIKKYGVDNYMKLPAAQENMKLYFLEKFGATSPLVNPKIKEKTKLTCQEKYGVEDSYLIAALPEFKEKIRNTCIKNHGVPVPAQNPEILQKIQNTCFKNYGVFHATQNPDIMKKARSKYYFNNLYFDSIWELAFYIEHKDDKDFHYHEDFIEYKDFSGNIHIYYPDFRIGDTFYEIKGNHMMDNEGNLIDFYNKGINQEILDCKQKCMKNNNVIIISYDAINPLIKKYGKSYLKSFKLKNKNSCR